jgi:hypothetical protein
VLSALAGALTAALLALSPLPTGTDVDYQLGGASDPAANVGIVVRDRTEAPSGRFDVCYVNAFQTQPDAQRFWRRHAGLVLRDGDGRPVVDEAWGEKLLDLRTPAERKALARIVGRWVAGCAATGYDAVEYDNLDSWTRSHGLLSKRQAMAYARLITAEAHEHGLSAGQKNTPQLDGPAVGYDFAVAEECGRYDECQRYVDRYGDQVLMVEYRAQDFAKTCAAFGTTHAVVLRDLDLTPEGVHQWC